MTAIYGKSLVPSIEPIETEAIFHFWPGAKILSIGNLGCNLSCAFCQNWESSDIANLSPEHVRHNTPKELVTLAETLGIKVISFTYNDPVIWFEHVYETARMAKKKAIKTLFKSAAFISEAAARRLTEVIDVFSISLKTIDPTTFTQISKGILSPVLEAIKIFHRSPRHLEISNLVVTGLTDDLENIRQLSRWVRSELSENVPLHFVRFHPAHKYAKAARTPIETLEKARGIALEEGLRYVHIGNTYRNGDADIPCSHCGSLLVRRYGLYTKIEGISEDGNCIRCSTPQSVTIKPLGAPIDRNCDSLLDQISVWKWRADDIRNLHLEINNPVKKAMPLICEHIGARGNLIDREHIEMPGGKEMRFAVGQEAVDEKEIRILYPKEITCRIAGLEDRAHFPLQAMSW
jgi:pyruvate formate lyase activating enzyme